MNSAEQTAVFAMLDEAEAIALRHFRQVKPQWKASHSYVTEADYEVQDCIISWLNKHHSDDGIIAEERSLHRRPGIGSRSWIIDPIDGTASFVNGFPTWGIGLALVEGYEPVAGFFACPVTRERFWAVKGQGMFRNGEQVSVHSTEHLHSETTLLAFSRTHRASLVRQDFPGKVRSLGSTIAHSAYAAAGSCDTAILAYSMIWDLAPGLIMLEEAGGVMRYPRGRRVSLEDIWDGGPTRHPVLCGHSRTVDLIERQAVNLR